MESFSEYEKLSPEVHHHLFYFYNYRDRKIANKNTFERKLKYYFTNSDGANRIFEPIDNSKPFKWDWNLRFKIKIPIPDLLGSCINNLIKRDWYFIPHFLDLDKAPSDENIDLYHNTFVNEPVVYSIPQDSIPEDYSQIGMSIANHKEDTPSINLDKLRQIAIKLDKVYPWENSSQNRIQVLDTFISNLRSSNGNLIKEKDTSIYIPNGLINIINAPTSSGKSVFMDLIALSQAQIMPVIIVVDRIEECLNKLLDFQKAIGALNLDLKVESFIAPKRKYKYMARIFESHKDEPHSEIRNIALKELTYVCRLNRYKSDNRNYQSGSEPCKILKYKPEDFKSKGMICPFFQDCSKYKSYYRCGNADLIITTKSGLLKARVPVPIKEENNQYQNYSFIEFALKYSGLILIDEVETLHQNIADSLSNEYDFSKLPKLIHNLSDLIYNNKIPRETQYSEIKAALNILSSSIDFTEEWLHFKILQWPSLHLIRKIPNMITLEYLIAMCLNNWSTLIPLSDDNLKVTLFYRIFDNSNFNEKSLKSIIGNNKELIIFLQKIFSIKIISEGINSITKIQEIKTELISTFKKFVIKEDHTNEQLEKKITRFTENFLLLLQLKRIQQNVGDAISKLSRLSDLPIELDEDIRKLLFYNHLMKFSPYGCITKNYFSFEYEIGVDQKPGKISIKSLTGTPHKILSDLGNDYSYLLAKKKNSILGLSATSYFPLSSKYHVFGNVLGMIPDHSSKDEILIDQYLCRDINDKYIRVSGLLKPQLRRKGIIDLTKKTISRIEDELMNLQKNDPTRHKILIVTNSYLESYWVAEYLANSHLKNDFCVVLKVEHIENSLRKNWLPKNKLKDFADYPQRILISPLSIISRGHNILNMEGRSIISSIFVFVRPLPNMSDPCLYLLYLSYHYIKRIKENNIFCSDNFGNAFFKNYRMLRKDEKEYQTSLVPFSKIGYENIQLGIVADIIVDLIQLMGRGRRGTFFSKDGAPISLYFIDGAFSHWKSLIKKLFRKIHTLPQWSYFYQIYKPIIKSFMDFAEIEFNGD